MNRRITLLFATLAVLHVQALARGELQVETKSADQGELTIFRMTVTPAAEPVPALRNRLLMRDNDAKAGNAAPMYYRAFLSNRDLGIQFRAKFGDSYAEDYPWADQPWPNAKLQEAAKIISSSAVLTHLREATSRESCEWAFDLRSLRGPEMYGFLLPEVQDARQLARHLTVLTQVAIHEQRYDDALAALRMNNKLARDIGSEPLLVCGLVGFAIAGLGDRSTIDLIAAPDSPNLYWALAELPDPLIDLRPAVRFEMSSPFRISPLLRDAETQEHSPQEWARLLAEGLDSLTEVNGSFANETTTRVGVAALGIATYAPAKRRLIAGGMDAARVEQMPVGQVLSIDAEHEFRLIADEFEKWWYLPYTTSREHGHDGENLLGGNKLSGGYGRLLASMLLPAVSAVRTVQERHQWQVDGLRTVEAIRMHAAKAGKLPQSLAEIEVVPVPINRVTGKPYLYHLDGDTGVVELPFSDGVPSTAWRFEIKLAK